MRVTKQDKLRLLKSNYSKHNVWSTDDLKRLHRGHFFSPDTMRFFASRLIQDVFPTASGLVYFVTSEKACFNDPSRVYSVRCYNIQNDSFNSEGKLDTRAQALSLALELAYQNEVKEGVTSC